MQLASPNHTRARIGLWAASLTAAQERLIAILGQRFAVQFVRCDSRSVENLDGVVTLGCSEQEVGIIGSSGLPLLSFDKTKEPCTVSGHPICFTDSADSPDVLRGRCFAGAEPREFRVIRPQPGESVLATIGGLPVWTVFFVVRYFFVSSKLMNVRLVHFERNLLASPGWTFCS